MALSHWGWRRRSEHLPAIHHSPNTSPARSQSYLNTMALGICSQHDFNTFVVHPDAKWSNVAVNWTRREDLHSLGLMSGQLAVSSVFVVTDVQRVEQFRDLLLATTLNAGNLWLISFHSRYCLLESVGDISHQVEVWSHDAVHVPDVLRGAERWESLKNQRLV